MESLSIEPMRLADLETVYCIDKRCFPIPWLTHAFETEMTNRRAGYFVARLNQEIVGYAGQWIIRDEAHITTLAVLPEFQRKKIGERLLQTLIKEAVLQGAVRAILEVRESNQKAQRLYLKYGFRAVALRKKYYGDNNENAVVMWLDDMHKPAYQQLLRELYEKMWL